MRFSSKWVVSVRFFFSTCVPDFPNFHGIDFDPVGAGCSRAIFSLDGLFLCDCLIDLVFPIFRILMLLILTLYGPVVHVRFSSRSVVSVRFCFRFGFCQHSEV